MTLEAGEAKIDQHLLVGQAVTLADEFLMETEEKERKEEDMSEQAYWMLAGVLRWPCYRLRWSSSQLPTPPLRMATFSQPWLLGPFSFFCLLNFQ